ncbi:serine/threonine protein kinase [Marinicella rhabdoformis]|uniref:serine/threonine protein kinase n=1 Tax=Marinicella rhabdoformis TaxID=2580566 RepID=UPI0012AEDC0F|nr:serine/threonine-protein kinase [Marinicella rhabdoformis]
MSDSDKPTIKSTESGSLADEPTVLIDTEGKAILASAFSGTLSPGTRINRIVIDSLIGQGGMGAVYLAYDEKLQRQVAIKSIRPEFLTNPDTQKRFMREARILSKINHQSICHIYDYIETDVGDYLVLEYIKGQQIYHSSLDKSETLDALIALAEALDVAHQHGVIHRDLKPDNVMVTTSGQIKVLDFGIAQSMSNIRSNRTTENSTSENKTVSSELTEQGSLVGTIRYMSPEQARGEVLTPASDIYALGVMAMEMLSKKPAYAVLQTEELLRDVQKGRLQPAKNLAPDCRSLVTALTAVEFESRPSAKQAAESFKKIKQAPQMKRRKRTKWLVLFFGFVATGFMIWQWQVYKLKEQQANRIMRYEGAINQLVMARDQVYTLPIHNVTQEINDLFSQSAVLFQKINVDEILNQQQIDRLHGLIFLKSEQYQMAVKKLESGLASNEHMARAWVGLYINKVAAYSEKHGYIGAVQSRDMQLNFLRPALDYVEKALLEAAEREESQDTVLKAFWVAHSQGIYGALRVLDDTLKGQMWNHELVKLKALLLSTLALDFEEKAQYELSYDAMKKTADTYRQAIDMARSFPYSYHSLCATEINLVVDAVSRTYLEFDLHAAHAIEACENYLLVSPGSTAGLNQLTLLSLMKAFWHILHGQSPRNDIEQAVMLNQKSLSIAKLAQAKILTAYIYAVEASWLSAQGQGVENTLDQAYNALSVLVNEGEMSEDDLAVDFLNVINLKAEQQVRLLDPLDDLINLAEKHFNTGINASSLLYENKKGLMGSILHTYTQNTLFKKHTKGRVHEVASAYLPQFESSYEYIKFDPNSLLNYAQLHLLMGEYGEDGKMAYHVNMAQKFADEAFAINQSSQAVLLAQAVIMNWQVFLQSGEFESVDQAFEKAIAVNPEWAQAYQAWAEAKLIQARNAESEVERQKAVKTGIEKISSAIEKDPLNQTFRVTKSRLKALNH